MRLNTLAILFTASLMVTVCGKESSDDKKGDEPKDGTSHTTGPAEENTGKTADSTTVTDTNPSKIPPVAELDGETYSESEFKTEFATGCKSEYEISSSEIINDYNVFCDCMADEVVSTSKTNQITIEETLQDDTVLDEIVFSCVASSNGISSQNTFEVDTTGTKWSERELDTVLGQCANKANSFGSVISTDEKGAEICSCMVVEYSKRFTFEEFINGDDSETENTIQDEIAEQCVEKHLGFSTNN